SYLNKDTVYLSQDTLNDSVVYENKDIPDPTSPYIPKSFVIALRDYISGVQSSSIPHSQERMCDFKNTINFGTLGTEDYSRQVSFYDYFDLLIGPAINNYQMSRTKWSTCSTMIIIVTCVMIILLRNVWLIFFDGLTRTQHVVVKFRFIHPLINLCSYALIPLSCMTTFIAYLNSFLFSSTSISIASIISNLPFFDKFVTRTKLYNNNSSMKVLIWPLLIVIISFFAFCAYDHSSEDRPFGKQVYVEKYMPIPKDYKPITPVVLPEEDYTYDKIYSHFRGVLDCRFISIEHSRAVKGFIVDANWPLFDYSENLNLQKPFKSSNRTLGFDHIYIVHLDYRTDRRERLDELASYLGLDFDYLSAISKNDEQILRKYGSADMISPQKACYLSHCFIYKEIIDKGYNNALILEDDVDFELNITAIMTDIHRDLPASWEMLYVGHCFEDVGEQVGISSSVHRLYKSVAPMCTHAYAVSYSGARKLIELVDPVIPRGTIDYSLSVVVKDKKVNSFDVHPPAISQWKAADNPSDIPSSQQLSISLLNSTLHFLQHNGY
ncbi:1768_t:CDS:2, partial [Dentiscutata erythropus]